MCETTPTKVWQIALNCKFILQLEFILLIYYQSVFLYLKSFFTFLLKLFYFSSQIIQGTQFLFTHLTVIFFSIDYPGQIIKGFLFIWIVIICFPIRLLYWLLVFIKIYLIQWSLTVRLIVIVRFLVLFFLLDFLFIIIIIISIILAIMHWWNLAVHPVFLIVSIFLYIRIYLHPAFKVIFHQVINFIVLFIHLFFFHHLF